MDHFCLSYHFTHLCGDHPRLLVLVIIRCPGIAVAGGHIFQGAVEGPKKKIENESSIEREIMHFSASCWGWLISMLYTCIICNYVYINIYYIIYIYAYGDEYPKLPAVSRVLVWLCVACILHEFPIYPWKMVVVSRHFRSQLISSMKACLKNKVPQTIIF